MSLFASLDNDLDSATDGELNGLRNYLIVMVQVGRRGVRWADVVGGCTYWLGLTAIKGHIRTLHVDASAVFIYTPT